MSIITTKGWIVDTVVAWQGITVDNTDPANPIVISDIVAWDYYTKTETDNLLDTKQNLLPIPTTGVGSSSTNPTYALQDGTILYHSSRWFTPSGTVSTSGVTVTSIGTQFTSAMVGAKITINGESRIIVSFTSTTVVQVGVPYSTGYSGIAAWNWGVYSRSEWYNGVFKNFINQVGELVFRTVAGNSVGFSNWVELTGNAWFYSDNFTARRDYKFVWSSDLSPFGTKDLWLRRNAAGVLEIFDGVTATGLLANRRDLMVRKLGIWASVGAVSPLYVYRDLTSDPNNSSNTWIQWFVGNAWWSNNYNNLLNTLNVTPTSNGGGQISATMNQVVKKGNFTCGSLIWNSSSFGSFDNGITPSMQMFYSRVWFESGTTGSITNLYHFVAESPYGTGTIWNIYGLYIKKQLKTGVTNARWVYQVDTADKNYFAGNVILWWVLRLKNYTVATLPAGTQWDTAYVTDALLPTYLWVVVWWGAVRCPVFFNWTNWIS